MPNKYWSTDAAPENYGGDASKDISKKGEVFTKETKVDTSQ